MSTALLVFGIIAVFMGGWLIGRSSILTAIRKQEEADQRVRDSLYVPTPPPLTKEEEAIIKMANEAMDIQPLTTWTKK